jgi:hypothetical protein
VCKGRTAPVKVEIASTPLDPKPEEEVPMWRSRLLFALLLTLSAAWTWAGQPWKQKPFEKWDKHDVDQILRNSPWAQVITVAYSPLAFTSNQPETGVGTQVGRVIRDPGKDPLDVGGADSKVWTPEGVFVLRWESSRTIRRALARKAVLQGSKTPALSEAQLTTEPEDYELVMVAESIVRLPDNDAATLASNTYIQGKLAGEKVHPQRIEFRDDPNTGRTTAVVFHFARQTPEGQPVVRAHEEAVEFFCQVGPRVFHAKFVPKQMASPEGPDL